MTALATPGLSIFQGRRQSQKNLTNTSIFHEDLVIVKEPKEDEIL